MKLGVLKESKEKEKRVALSPDVIKLLIKKGFEVSVETGAGEGSSFSDATYQSAGATIAGKNEICGADVILKVNAPTLDEASQMKTGAIVISLLYAYTQAPLLDIFKSKQISAFAMDAVPRISRAQKMDFIFKYCN